MIFDFLDRSALRNIGRRSQAIPKNGDKDVALFENLAIDDPLSTIRHIWKRVSFPSDRLQDRPVCFRMHRIPFVALRKTCTALQQATSKEIGE
jgi:hypothetical protein